MLNPDDIAADLPAPRDDEPESLRRDIVDELSDHLQCALHRELLVVEAHPPSARGEAAVLDFESKARQRVGSRFGNPARIARRLWWEAMKDTIMSQRITAAMSAVAAIACCAMFVLLWQVLADNRELLRQSQDLNAQLLEQMQALLANARMETTGPGVPSEWNRLQIKCVLDRADGPPATGVQVKLTSASENTGGIPPAEITSGADGVVDFGMVLFGQYAVQLTAPNKMVLNRSVAVRPGHDALETIVCPSGDGLAALSVRPELKGAAPVTATFRDRIWYRFSVRRAGYSTQQWSRPVHDSMEEHEGSWFISPGGEIVAGDFGKALFALIDAGGIESQTAQSTVPPPDGVLAGLTYGVWTLPDGVRPAPTILVEPGAYQLGAASICIQDDGDPTGRTLLQVLTPDRESQLGSYSSRDEGWKVVWGQPNELSLPVWTGPLLMLDRALACAPPMDAVTLHLSRPVALRSDFRRQKRATQGDRVDIRISGARYGAPSPSRERLERPTKLLDGVEVLSYRPLNIPTPERMRTQYELRVLLTPEERALLFQLQSYLEAAVVDPETERTSLDAEVRRQVEERFELTGSS